MVNAGRSEALHFGKRHAAEKPDAELNVREQMHSHRHKVAVVQACCCTDPGNVVRHEFLKVHDVGGELTQERNKPLQMFRLLHVQADHVLQTRSRLTTGPHGQSMIQSDPISVVTDIARYLMLRR